jgi:hypothetical protein
LKRPVERGNAEKETESAQVSLLYLEKAALYAAQQCPGASSSFFVFTFKMAPTSLQNDLLGLQRCGNCTWHRMYAINYVMRK